MPALFQILSGCSVLRQPIITTVIIIKFSTLKITFHGLKEKSVPNFCRASLIILDHAKYLKTKTADIPKLNCTKKHDVLNALQTADVSCPPNITSVEE